MYNKEVAQTPPSARPRAFEANLLLAKLIQCVQNHFGSDLKRGKYGRLMLTVNGYIIFFKKLDKNDMPMNIRTVLSDSIENQLQGSLLRMIMMELLLYYFLVIKKIVWDYLFNQSLFILMKEKSVGK